VNDATDTGAVCADCACTPDESDPPLRWFHDGADAALLCKPCHDMRRHHQDEGRKARTAANNARTGLAKNQLRRERSRQRARAKRKQKARQPGRAQA